MSWLSDVYDAISGFVTSAADRVIPAATNTTQSGGGFFNADLVGGVINSIVGTVGQIYTQPDPNHMTEYQQAQIALEQAKLAQALEITKMQLAAQGRAAGAGAGAAVKAAQIAADAQKHGHLGSMYANYMNAMQNAAASKSAAMRGLGESLTGPLIMSAKR